MSFNRAPTYSEDYRVAAERSHKKVFDGGRVQSASAGNYTPSFTVQLNLSRV
jgi:hypothetical protein